jgi:signal transduction histidine kinase/BarA-like signal transduction histidine kinase
MPDSKTKILLVVDNFEENIAAMSKIIAADDVEIHSFLHFDEALSSLNIHDYGLAILDVQMTGMSGVELSKNIRAIKQYAYLPIIFVTSQQNNDATVLEGYETGAVDLLFKPINPYILQSKVKVFVELKRQRQLMQMQLHELEILRVAAEAATVAKTQFLANMSHEIRTPLAAVMGFADMLARGEIPAAETDECAASIRRNGNLLLRLIDDILDLSMIEANRLEMEMENHSLKELMSDIESTLSFKAKEKGIVLQFNKPDIHGMGHLFDPIRMKQIFLNIIGNAVKFSDKGEVVVNVDLTTKDDKHDLLTVVVANEGEGISVEQSDRLFQLFGQADATVKRKFGGSGLGLIISRQLARAMKGDVVLLNAGGTGAKFQITAILERSKFSIETLAMKRSSFEAEKLTMTFPGKHLLVVDDARDNIILLDLFLRGTEMKITTAVNGLEAVELAKANNYDMILMDIHMPVMDGLEATETIRRSGVKIPIIALTAFANKVEYDKCRKAGCNDALIKPLSKNSLLKTISHFFNV